MRKSKNGNDYDPSTIGLEKGTFAPSKRWALDYDYIDELRELAEGSGPKAEEAKAALLFMSKFNQEYYKGRQLNKEDRLHNTKKLQKDCTDRNNASNRDLYAKASSQGKLTSPETWDEVEILDSFTKENKKKK